jgi:hypothetical protein
MKTFSLFTWIFSKIVFFMRKLNRCDHHFVVPYWARSAHGNDRIPIHCIKCGSINPMNADLFHEKYEIIEDKDGESC